ncbi:TetR/AcrR family transcriptional regulator [Rathayibacter sp. Leaf296]|uniref:TetR/AcrR family transcriptional regulator n=1 Tax=Rathayibacter sp. Leaf296 TaxID=1736327 RepID=UPI000703B9A7|nr:TetR/AcrR family transcriptional regulator [Rathayibacter sp. Leaf296]KQQ10224.1 hypothetical protein ASF46_03880 [Rathayibacter sp. Leaf296]
MSQTPVPPATPARAPRLTREQVRSRLVDAGLDVVRSDGLRVGVSHLPLEDLIRTAGVPRSTVYRIWPSRQDFFDELLARIPDRLLSTRLDEPALQVGATYLQRNTDAEAPADERRATLVASVAVAIEANYENTFASRHWRNFVSLAGTVESHDEPVRGVVHDALRKRQQHFIENMAKYYRYTLTEAGLRLRPGFGDEYTALASAISAYIEGLCVARIAAPELVTGPLVAERPESPSLVVAGVMMLIDGFCEPIPEG